MLFDLSMVERMGSLVFTLVVPDDDCGRSERVVGIEGAEGRL
jgi:hypothetical protein